METAMMQWLIYVPRPSQSEVCPDCKEGFEMTDGAMRVKSCQHFYHEECVARKLSSRAHGELRCPLCHVKISMTQNREVRVRKNSDAFMKNSLCWICKMELTEESPYDMNRKCVVTPKRGRIARVGWVRATMIDTLCLDECDHVYHEACFKIFLTDADGDGTYCGHCRVHFAGKDLEYVRFDDDRNAAGTVDDEVRATGTIGGASGTSTPGTSALAQYVSSSGSDGSG